MPPNASGPLTIEITVRGINGNVSVLVFTINIKSNQPGGELILPQPLRDAAMPERRASFDRGFDIGPLIDLGDWTPRGVRATGLDAADATPAGRAGLSAQIAASGWRAMHAERLALVDSLARQNAALH